MHSRAIGTARIASVTQGQLHHSSHGMNVGTTSSQSYRASTPVDVAILDVPPKSIAHLKPATPCTEELWRDATLNCLLANEHDGLDWLSRHQLSNASRSGVRVIEVRPPPAMIDLRQPNLWRDGADLETLRSLCRWLGSNRPHPVALELNLSNNRLEPGSAEALAAMLRTTTRVTSLDVSGCRLTAQEVRTLCEAMERNSSMASLKWFGNDCSASAEAIAAMLRQSTTLKLLDVEGCDLGPGGVRAIGEALLTNQTLQTLNLSQTRLEAEDWLAMKDVLAKNKTMLDLRMSMEPLPSSEIFDKFCAALACNTTLNRLALLRKGTLSPDQTDSLSRALGTNTSLEHLGLWQLPSWPPSSPGTERVLKGLSKNCGLQSLEFVGASFDKEDCNALVSLLTNEKNSLGSLKFSLCTWPGEGDVSAVSAAVIGNRTLKDFEHDWTSLPRDENEAIESTLNRNRYLHEAALQAANYLWTKAGLTLPDDMVVEVGKAFKVVTGWTCDNVVKAVLNKD
jgi:hypothetical protein